MEWNESKKKVTHEQKLAQRTKNRNNMVVTILRSHHKFTPPIVKKLKMHRECTKWIVESKRAGEMLCILGHKRKARKKKGKKRSRAVQ